MRICALIGIMLLLMLSACGFRGKTKVSNQTRAEISASGDIADNESAEYCLLRPKLIQSRKIFSRPTSYFQSDDGFNYEIRGSLTDSQQSIIKIEDGDRFTLKLIEVTGELSLVHLGNDNIVKARATLDPEGSAGSTRWMYGRAEDSEGKSLGGDYFVYSMDIDTPCRRITTPPQASCKVLRFEFFDRRVSSVLNQKPFNCGVVLPFESRECEKLSGGNKDDELAKKVSGVDAKSIESKDKKLETSEGDGDHGPNTN